MSERLGVWVLRALVGLGVVSLGFYFSWWFQAGRIASPGLALGLALAALYDCFQIGGSWFFYLKARGPRAPGPRPPGLTVDVLVTACGEDLALVRRCLRAAVEMKGEHRTWLLDDGHDPALAALADGLGAGYLVRQGRADAKAGNLNAALPRTDGDVVAIFDVDHAPDPAFLERTLGHFADPEVGFVQVMLTFDNGGASWVARAAVDTSLDFHNPTSMGMDSLGTATLHGSNALIRRTALESIGGYRPGLAEDLATSLALHAAGWRSAFVVEPLAPGLAPVELGGWFTQQLKWSRGVFEVLLTQYPRALAELRWGQRLAYAVRSTYYWIGGFVGIHLVLLLGALFLGRRVVTASFQDYLVHFLPLGLMFFTIRKTARALWRHPSTPIALEWRGLLLVYASWPVYTLAWLMALARIPLGFRMTPKTSGGRVRPLWLAPQALSLVLLLAGLARAALGPGWPPALILSGALVQVGMLASFFGCALPRGAGRAALRATSDETKAYGALPSFGEDARRG
jgi:cellulose synthase (UDP-forming)